MQLYWSSRSPYVRKVMIVAAEAGVMDRIALIPTVASPEKVNPELSVHNPLGQIPTLILDDGTALTGSSFICDYLNVVFGGGRLLPVTLAARLDAQRRQALGDGLIDRSIRWLSENFRPESQRSETIVAVCRDTIRQTLDRLDRDAKAWTHPFDMGDAIVGCALSYLDFRFGQEAWREGRPTLAARYDVLAHRPSMQATEFKG